MNYYGYNPYINQPGQQLQPMQDNLAMLRAQYQPQTFPTHSPETPQDEKIWVQGEEAARAYLVAPNGFVRLWDSIDNVFYEKTADGTGRPMMRKYKYSEIDGGTQPHCDSLSEYVKKEEFEKLRTLVEELASVKSSEV